MSRIDDIRKALDLPEDQALEAIRLIVTDKPRNADIPITNLDARRAEFMQAASLDTGTPMNTPDNRPATVFGSKPRPAPLTPAQQAQMESDRAELNRMSEDTARQFRKGWFES